MKILYVEDEIAHVMLTERTLQENLHQEFLLLHAEKVSDALKFLDAEPDIDLVLSDLRLPDGTGLELLKKIRERKDPPAVVLVTGQGDQEAAVAALKAGAADYLVKQSDYLHRLPVVLSNAVAQNRYLREREALYQAEFKYQSLIEQTPAVVFLIEAGDARTLIYVSPRIEELTGYAPSEWHADQNLYFDSIHPEDRKRITENSKTASHSGSRFLEEYRVIRRDSKIVWIKEDTNLIHDKEGKPLYWQGILLDITKEKESEAALQWQLKELATLHSASLAASTVLRFDELIEQVTNAIGSTLYPDNFGILLFDAKAGTIRPHPSYRGTTQEHLSAVLPAAKSITGKVALTGKPVRLEDVTQDLLYLEVTTGVQSELCVPILVRGQVIGVINAESKKRAAFSNRDERLLTTVANTLATAADKLRSFEEARQRAAELEALYQASRALALSLDPQIIGKNLVRTMDELLGYEYASVHLMDEQGEFLVHLAISPKAQSLESYIGDKEVLRSQKIPLGAGLVGWVAKHKQSIRAGDVAKDERYLATYKNIKSELCVPLMARGKVIGVLNIQSTELDAYTERDESLLTALANSAAIALENARLYESELARRKQAEILRAATASLSTALDLQSLYQIILDSVAKLVPYDRAFIEITNHGCQEIVAEDGFPANWRVGQKSYPRDPDKWAEWGKLQENQQKPLVLGDMQSEGWFIKDESNAAFHSWIGAAMAAGDKVFGLLNLESRTPNYYTEEQAALVQTFANQAGIAIEKAQLYQDAVRAADRRAVLHRISQDIVRFSQDSEQIYAAIHEAAYRLMTCDVFMIILRDETKDENVSVYAVEAGERFTLERVPGAKGLTGLVINNGKSLILRNEAEIALREIFHFGSARHVQAVVAVPLRAGDQIIGMISAQSYEPYAYDLEEQALLEMLATHAATAIENSRLFISEKKRRQEAETLRQAASVISSTLDPGHVVKEILVALKQVIPYDNASVFLLEGNQLRIAMAHGQIHANELTNLAFPDEDEFFKIIKRTGRPVILQDAQKDPRFKNWGGAHTVRGWMAVPLVTRGRVIGLITLDSYESSTYESTIVETAMAFANQAAAGIENARLYNETQRRLKELEIINRVSTSLRMTQSLSEMLSILLSETLRLVNTPHGSIWLYDHTSDQLIQCFAKGAEAKLKYKSLGVATGIVGQTFKTGKIYISPELKSDALLFEGNRDSVTPGLGGVYIPIQSTGGPVGVLTLELEKGRQIPDEINLLTILAEITGNSIHRAQLYEQSQRQVRRLTSLRDIDSAIASSFDLRLTLNILMDQTLSHLNVDAVSIGLYHPDLQALTYLPAIGFHTPSPTRPQVRIGEGLAGQVIVKQQTCLINNLQTAPETGNEPLIRREGFASYIGVPLIVKGQIKGVFEVFHRAHLTPTPDWMEFLHTLAGQAAIAIDSSQLFENLQRSNQELVQAYDVTLEGWARALELRDRETEGHTRRVTELTLHLARYMGIGENELVNIHRGVLLHDIGKMGVPDHILKKTGRLDKHEWIEMRQHPVYAYNLLSPIAFLRNALDIPYCHHEHWDGSGYPRGLKGEQIPLSARMFAVVDNWDALLSDRPYRKAWPRKDVIAYIRENAGTLFDPRIVDIFLSMLEKDKKQTDQ